MRIANNTIVRSYTHNLNSNLNRLNGYSNQIVTGRKFSNMSEDPVSAMRAMNIRRSLSRIDSYKDNIKSLQSKWGAAESALGQMSDRCKDVSAYFVQALNGDGGMEERAAIAQNLENLRDEIIDLANTRFAGSYLFGGTNVNNSQPFQRTKIPGSDPAEYRLTYNGEDIFNITAGDKYFTDSSFVDIGLDMNVDSSTGTISGGTAFNNSLKAIDYLGVGDENLIYILDGMIDALRSENFDPKVEREKLTSFQEATSRVNLGLVKIGSDCNTLDYMFDRLETEEDNLIQRQDAIEFVAPEDAIMAFKMQEYVYNAALQMGQRLLQPSLFNFLN